MILLAAGSPILINLVLLGAIIIAIGAVLRRYRQPYIIAYILAGVVIGDSGLDLITDEATIRAIGDFGLIILLFFIGMEISLPKLVKNWRVPTIGTLLQICGSVLLAALIGKIFDWEMNRIVAIGFIISLSSSAVVIKLLQDNNEVQTRVGQSVVSILLMQDILIVPLLIFTNYLGGNEPTLKEIALQVIGGLLIIGGIVWVLRKEEINLPFSESLQNDHELQVFLALVICFGCAVITAFFGLSAALGAFVGGMFVHSARATHWIHDSMHSFRVIFVSVFFISIGMMIDLNFLVEHWLIVLVTLSAVYLGNHFINAAILQYFCRNWKESLYGGALLAQVGELSFVLASTAYASGIIADFGYQLSLVVISLTLLISPFWISGTKRIVGFSHPAPDRVPPTDAT